jgi:hypothetical protein
MSGRIERLAAKSFLIGWPPVIPFHMIAVINRLLPIADN